MDLVIETLNEKIRELHNAIYHYRSNMRFNPSFHKRMIERSEYHISKLERAKEIIKEHGLKL